jgi:hypothetical protein
MGPPHADEKRPRGRVGAENEVGGQPRGDSLLPGDIEWPDGGGDADDLRSAAATTATAAGSDSAAMSS